MKRILHVTGTFKNDGSTYSTILLHNYLRKQGISSSIAFLSENKSSRIFNINPGIKNRLKFFFLNKINSLIIRIFKKDQNFAFFNNTIDTGLKDIIKNTNPDIIHFHWMPRSIKLEYLPYINKKIVWTIRDFWPFTGGCNVPLNCNKFLYHCENCPHLIFKNKKDLSFHNYKEKKKVYRLLKNITLTFPCSDFEKIYKKSILRVIKKNKVIPNALDKSFLKLEKKKFSMKYTILFGAQNLDQEWKGTKIIIDLINCLKDENIDFIIFGKTTKYLNYLKENKKVNYLGYIASRNILKKTFMKSDLFIFPSHYESFGKLIIESLACGVPVVANSKFGAKDIISHKKDGFLVNNQNFNEYINGINFFRNQNQKKIEKNCFSKSKKYQIEIIGKKFIDLYSKL